MKLQYASLALCLAAKVMAGEYTSNVAASMAGGYASSIPATPNALSTHQQRSTFTKQLTSTVVKQVTTTELSTHTSQKTGTVQSQTKPATVTVASPTKPATITVLTGTKPATSSTKTHTRTTITTNPLTPAQLAVQNEMHQCREIVRLEELVMEANNATRISEAQQQFGWSSLQVSQLKSAAASAPSQLAMLRSNATLLMGCAHLALLKDCRDLTRLQLIVEVISNATLIVEVQIKQNWTTVEVENIKAELPMYQSRLNALQSNATLINDCKMLSMTTATSATTKPTSTVTVNINTSTMAHATTAATTAARTTAALNSTARTNATATGTLVRQTINAAPALTPAGSNFALIANGLFVALVSTLAGSLFVW